MEYGIREHALYYALLSKQIFSVLSHDEAKLLLKDITMEYGRRRGRRMRRNAEDAGCGCDLQAFFTTGEWAGKPDENRSELIRNNDSTESRVSVCAWYDTWEIYGLLSFGTYYCRWIDSAIAEGFAGSFTLAVPCTKGNGDPQCRFVWDQALPDNPSQKPFLLPFRAHIQELKETAREVLELRFPEITDDIMKRTEESFRALCQI